MNEHINSEEKGFLSMLFSFRGRINRQEYFIYGVLIPFIFIGLGFLRLHMEGENVYLLSIFVGAIIQLASSVKRARDRNENIVVVVIALLLPYISFLVVLYLLIAPSKVLEEGSVKKSRTVLYILLAFLVFIMIGLVSAILLPKFMDNSINSTKMKLVCTQMKNISNNLELFKLDYGTYPSTKEDFEILTFSYLKKVPIDLWGNEIEYVEKTDSFELISYGEDGVKSRDDIVFSNCSENK